MEEARRWYDRLSPWYDLLIDPFASGARGVGLDLLAPQEGEVVLDIGCGTGSALVDLAGAVEPTGAAIGLDLSEGMCRRAKRRLNGRDFLQTDVVIGDARSLPFADATFDRAFASFVLDLFDTRDLPGVAAEWRRVLTPEGTLVVVALSRRTAGTAVRTYEWLHRRFPAQLDCRPIHPAETLRMGGFRVDDRVECTIGGLPIDVVRVRPR